MPFWCCTACAAMAADARAPPPGEVVDGGRQHEARRVVARHHHAVDVAHDLVRAQGGARLLVARTDLSASVWFEGSQVTSTVCFCHKTSCLELPHTVRTRWSTTEPGAGIELAYLAAITALSGLAARGCVHAARVFLVPPSLPVALRCVLSSWTSVPQQRRHSARIRGTPANAPKAFSMPRSSTHSVPSRRTAFLMSVSAAV